MVFITQQLLLILTGRQLSLWYTCTCACWLVIHVAAAVIVQTHSRWVGMHKKHEKWSWRKETCQYKIKSDIKTTTTTAIVSWKRFLYSWRWVFLFCGVLQLFRKSLQIPKDRDRDLDIADSSAAADGALRRHIQYSHLGIPLECSFISSGDWESPPGHLIKILDKEDAVGRACPMDIVKSPWLGFRRYMLKGMGNDFCVSSVAGKSAFDFVDIFPFNCSLYTSQP